MAKRKQSKRRHTNDAATEPQQPPSGDAPTPSEAESQVERSAAEVVIGETEAVGISEALGDGAAEPAAAQPAEVADAELAPAESTAWPEVAEPTQPTEPAPDDAAAAWTWPEGEQPATTDPGGDAATASAGDEVGNEGPLAAPEGSRLVSIVESLLFASDKPLGLSDLKRLLGERDGKKVAAALEELIQQRKGSGVEVATLSNGWALRTPPENAGWVSRLLVGRPIRLSRAMLETLSIVAYRQPVTRPEIDDIRGVDCGPVLKTLLDRGLVRIIGKKEEVGRPMLYGTTPEFLRVFNLRELAELPTLREFYDLTAEDQSRVEAEHGPTAAEPDSATSPKPEVALRAVARGDLPPEADETDPLIDELDEASKLAKKALGELEPTPDAAAESRDPDGRPAADPPAESRD